MASVKCLFPLLRWRIAMIEKLINALLRTWRSLLGIHEISRETQKALLYFVMAFVVYAIVSIIQTILLSWILYLK
jgi:hypothetical protein